MLIFFMTPVEVGVGVLDAVVDGLLDLGRELAEVEGLAGADVELREAGEKCALGGIRRAELEEKVDDGEDGRGWVDDVGGFGPVDGGRCGRRGLVEEGAERLGVIAGLDLVDLGQIGRVEELGAEEDVGELGFGVDDGFDACGLGAVPAGAGDEEGAAVVAVGAGAEVGEVVGVEIDRSGRCSSGWARSSAW